jgi:hypothetical protein
MTFLFFAENNQVMPMESKMLTELRNRKERALASMREYTRKEVIRLRNALHQKRPIALGYKTAIRRVRRHKSECDWHRFAASKDCDYEPTQL